MPQIRVGKFAIFDGEVGIIAGVDVPIDAEGRPTKSNATFVGADGTTSEQPHGEAEYLAVEFHPITSSGLTNMRVNEDSNGQPVSVETDIKYIVGSAQQLIEVLESTDERIPESRRAQPQE